MSEYLKDSAWAKATAAKRQLPSVVAPYVLPQTGHTPSSSHSAPDDDGDLIGTGPTSDDFRKRLEAILSQRSSSSIVRQHESSGPRRTSALPATRSTDRNCSPEAERQQQQIPTAETSPSSSSDAKKATPTRTFLGRVTSLKKDFGFVNEQVVFDRKRVIGPQPKEGERVVVEAQYTPEAVIKWTATSLHVVIDTISPINTTAGSATAPKAKGDQHPAKIDALREFCSRYTRGEVNKSAFDSLLNDLVNKGGSQASEATVASKLTSSILERLHDIPRQESTATITKHNQNQPSFTAGSSNIGAHRVITTTLDFRRQSDSDHKRLTELLSDHEDVSIQWRPQQEEYASAEERHVSIAGSHSGSSFHDQEQFSYFEDDRDVPLLLYGSQQSDAGSYNHHGRSRMSPDKWAPDDPSSAPRSVTLARDPLLPDPFYPPEPLTVTTTTYQYNPNLPAHARRRNLEKAISSVRKRLRKALAQPPDKQPKHPNDSAAYLKPKLKDLLAELGRMNAAEASELQQAASPSFSAAKRNAAAAQLDDAYANPYAANTRRHQPITFEDVGSVPFQDFNEPGMPLDYGSYGGGQSGYFEDAASYYQADGSNYYPEELLQIEQQRGPVHSRLSLPARRRLPAHARLTLPEPRRPSALSRLGH